MNTSKLAMFVACLSMFSISANAEYAEYKIKDAIEDAKLNNQELQIIDKNLSVRKLDRYRAASGFWPVAGAEASKTEGKISPTATTNYQDFDSFDNALYVQQELFAGGKTLAQMKIANSTVNAAELDFYSKTANVFLKVIDAYNEVISARRIYKISLNNEEGMRNRLEQIKTRFRVGEVTKTDVSWAKHSLAKAVTEKEEAFGDMKTAEANFTYIIGKVPGHNLVYVQASKINTPKDFETFATAVRQANLNLRIAQEQLHASKTSIAVAVSALMPTVTARMSVRDSQSSGQKGKTYALRVSMPLFNGNSYVDIKEARYKVRGAEAILNNTLGEVEQNIVQIWNQNQVAISQINSVKEALAAAQDALEGVQQEYKVGTKTTLDLLDSEQRLFEAQISQEKVNKALIISAFQMKALMGELHYFDFQNL
ncbi:MAG: TolC family protein [Candidatus Midichloria sp.]|nr:TolC family protein [Candidatus Midichloria sp.]